MVPISATNAIRNVLLSANFRNMHKSLATPTRLTERFAKTLMTLMRSAATTFCAYKQRYKSKHRNRCRLLSACALLAVLRRYEAASSAAAAAGRMHYTCHVALIRQRCPEAAPVCVWEPAIALRDLRRDAAGLPMTCMLLLAAGAQNAGTSVK